MKWLKWIGIVLASVILVFVLIVAWVLYTQSGARFALERAVGSMQGKLSYEKATGTLVSPLRLEGIRFSDPATGVDARVASAEVKISLSRLFSGRVQIDDVNVNGIDLQLTTVAPQPVEPSDPFTLEPPIDIVIDRLRIDNAKVTQDGKPVFAADSFQTGVAWTSDGIVVRELALRSPDGRVDVDGTLTTASGYGGKGKAAFSWKVGETIYAGEFNADSDGDKGSIAFALSQPIMATVNGMIVQNDQLPWTLQLDVPEFNASKLIADSGIKSLSASLQGSGDLKQGTVNGVIAVDGRRIQIEPLRYGLADDVLTIEKLTLKSPDVAGLINATGKVQLKGEPVSAELVLDWKDVVVPEDLAGQVIASHGKISASGNTHAYHADGTISVGPPGELSDLVIKLSGTPKQVLLDTLALKQAKGGLDASGTVTLQPQIGWDIKANASKLDPGAFAKDWKGALDFDLASSGSIGDNGPTATIKLDRLGGTLRQRPVSGQADLTIKPEFIVDGSLDLRSGKSTVGIIGRGGNQTDANIKLAIGDLGDWMPDASGQLNGDFRVQGNWPSLDVNGVAKGSALRFGDTRVTALDVIAGINNLDKPSGKLDVNAAGLTSGSASYESINLQAEGSQASHKLTLRATGAPANLGLQLDGSSKGDNWNGTLKQLMLEARDVPKFNLAAPAQLAWDGKKFTASDTCLVGDTMRLCVSGDGGADGSIDARYRLKELPLALITKLAASDAPIRATGTIDGNGSILRTAKGALSGNANISSATGRIDWVGADGAEPREMLSYTAFAINADLGTNATAATVKANLDHQGNIDGRIAINGPLEASSGLSGQLSMKLNSLEFIELFTSEVANVQGRVEADYSIAGTLGQPALNGALRLRDFASEVPIAGLKLSNGDISVRALDAQQFVVEGSIKSGKGTLQFGGNGGLESDAPIKVTIKGTDVTAANIPAAKVVVSPDLVIERSVEGLLVTGSVDIPSADVNLEKLPGGGPTGNARSADVVIVDEETSQSATALPVTARVTVSFGDNVKLVGLGLDGTVKGQLSVIDIPGRTTVGTGTLNVGGTYKAYGQDLKIERGRVLFAGTQIDNPGIDLRAVRKIRGEEIKVGLNVRGTAQIPVLTVFSDPVMEQSEALSYLLTGKPLSSLNSGEGDMLGSAARALGTAGGDLLAKNIGSKLGVDDIGVGDNDTLGGAAFTVGKYLSPKLYLSYGVGIFDPGEVVTLRYIFSPRWNFETENSTKGSRAGFNYRYEN
ncbi:MAG: translocation/assembly module TamB domain-containing protein [Dokdonella sp.]